MRRRLQFVWATKLVFICLESSARPCMPLQHITDQNMSKRYIDAVVYLFVCFQEKRNKNFIYKLIIQNYRKVKWFPSIATHLFIFFFGNQICVHWFRLSLTYHLISSRWTAEREMTKKMIENKKKSLLLLNKYIEFITVKPYKKW